MSKYANKWVSRFYNARQQKYKYFQIESFNKNFSSDTISGALIDAKLSEMDTEQIEYTQLNQKLLQCLHLYDTLMQQEQFSNPYMLNQQMGNMSLQVLLLSILLRFPVFRRVFFHYEFYVGYEFEIQTNMGYGGDPQMYSGHQMPPQNQYPPQMTQPMAHPMNHQPMTNQNQAYHSEHQQQHMSQPISQPMSQPQTTQPHQQMASMSQPQATQPQQMPPQQITSQQMPPQQMSQPPPQMTQQVPPNMQHLPPDQVNNHQPIFITIHTYVKG